MTRLAWMAPWLLAAAVAPQTGRDRAGVPVAAPAGTAALAGVIVESDATGAPVRRAIVMLTAAELPGGRTAISDDQGRFAFERLPAGRFIVAATKPAYLRGEFGASRAGRPGVPLQIAAGQTVGSVRIVLARGAAISGAIRDESGEPTVNLQVAAYRVPAPGAAPNLAITALAATDDRGVYRIYGLPPGNYLVATTRPVSARLTNIVALSSAEIDRALRELQQRSGLAVATTPSAAADPMPPGEYVAGPVFYPGVASPTAASSVDLAAGDERTGIDFVASFLRTVKIAGTVTYPPGPPPMVQFTIRTDGLRLPSLMGSVPVFSSKVEPPGRTFLYTGVTPGRYVITVRTRIDETLYARAEVDVAGTDITDLSLTFQPALTLSGRIVFDGKSPRPDPTAINIQLTAANDAGGGAAGTTQLGNFHIPPGTGAADGSFAIPNIIPEIYRLTTTVPASSGWWLRSAIVNGRDVLDEFLDIPPGANIAGTVLTYSDRQTSLSGALLTADGVIAPQYFIAVFPADRAQWRPGSRRIASARSGTDGRWIVNGLPAGDYLVAALTDLDADDLRDVNYLSQLVAAGIKVSLKEGEETRQDLRLGRR
jgi:hypothetical protein